MSILYSKGIDDLYIVANGTEIIADVADSPVDINKFETANATGNPVIETSNGTLIFFD